MKQLAKYSVGFLLALSVLLIPGFAHARERVEVSSFDELQAALTASEKELVITADIVFRDQLIVPAGADITLTDDGSPHRLTLDDSMIVQNTTDTTGKGMLLVESGARLAIAGTSNDHLLFDGEYPSKQRQGMDITNNGVFLTVLGNASVTHATFANSTNEGGRTAPLLVKDGGQLTIDDASIKNNMYHFTSKTVTARFNPEPATYMPQLAAKATAIAVDRGGVLTINGGVIEGNSDMDGSFVSGQPGAITLFGKGSKATINGGIFSRNYAFVGAVCFVSHGAELTINGGTFRDNIALYLGGVIYAAGSVFDVSQVDYTDYFSALIGTSNGTGPRSYDNLVVDPQVSRITINGGTFANNITYLTKENSGGQYSGAGGVLAAIWNTDITINGGIFTGNASSNGGALAVFDYWRKSSSESGNSIFNDDSEFRGILARLGMTDFDYEKIPWAIHARIQGGEFRNNAATSTGGAIYAGIKNFEIDAGIFDGNESARFGGAIYVSSVPYQMTLKNVLMVNNRALNDADIEDLQWSQDGQSVLLKNGSGGGLWYCPTGNTEFYTSNGGLIAGNEAERAGEDLGSVVKKQPTANQDPDTHDKAFKVDVHSRALGGSRIDWYADGSVSGVSLPRYQEGDAALDPRSLRNVSDELSLRAGVLPSAKPLAESLARVVFTNNVSARGGAIATNGTVVIGEKDQEFDLRVKKVWGSELKTLADADDTNVVVDLFFVDAAGRKTLVDTLDLNKAWSYEGVFENLPLQAGNQYIRYEVVERISADAEYTVTYQNNLVNTADLTQGSEVVCTIVNGLDVVPSNPVEPTPDNPVSADNPTTPGVSSSPQQGNRIPRAGESSMVVAIATTVLSTLSIVASLVSRKRR